MENYTSFNPAKCHCMCLGKSKENDTFNLENISIKKSKEEMILDLAIDNKLSFDNHVK